MIGIMIAIPMNVTKYTFATWFDSIFLLKGAVFISVEWNFLWNWMKIKTPSIYRNISRWFLQSAELYSPFIIVQLATNVFLMTFGIFQLDLVSKFGIKINDHSFKTILETLFSSNYMLATILFYCVWLSPP